MPDLNQISQVALSSFETLTTTYDLARLAIEHHIAGEFVECGVFGGAQCAAMALALMNHEPGSERRVHLFDCFRGLPEPGPEDLEFLNQGDMQGKACCSQENVQAHMSKFGIDHTFLVYHAGWFANTIPVWASSAPEIAILRIDADLYDSTMIPLVHLYSRVSRGGWVIVDDYALSGCRKAIHDFMLDRGGPNFPPIYWQKV